MVQENYTAVPLEDFNLLRDVSGRQQNVPVGWATVCTNMFAYPGRAATRPGLTSLATFGNDPVSIKEFVQQDVTTRNLLALTSDGTFYKETGSYTFSTISTDIIESGLASALRFNSVTQFGREYLAFSTNGLSGVSVPLAYDGTNLLRVSPQGPGDVNSVVVNEPGAGSIAAGNHSYRIAFLTSSGFITPPGPATTFTASGSRNAGFTGIPTGPSYVTARIICATAAGDTDFYYVEGSSMVINDNTTTTATIDFTDDQLISGTKISVSGDPTSDLLNCISIPAESSVFAYHGRLCWLGERTAYSLTGDIGFRGLSFDGGFATNRPLGWLENISGEAKGSGPSGATGDFLQITGDGATQKGCLENMGSPAQFIKAGTEVRARVRIRKSGAITGSFHVIAVANTGVANNTSTQNLAIDASLVSSSEWRVIDGQVLSAANNTLSSLWRLRISGGVGGLGGTVISNGGKFYIDWIEIYNGATPYQPSLARWSRAAQPDAYDALLGYQYVAQDNGQRVTCGFVLGDTAYFTKDRSLFLTRDDGSTEPANWPVSEVSGVVGTPSPNGVGIGDQWAVIAGRAGLYYFAGGQPVLLSDHVRNTWASINWQYGYLLSCAVDMDRKAIYVAAPLGTDTVAKNIICFQWFGNSLLGQDMQVSVHYFPTGISIADFATSERSDGTRHFIYATNGGSHRITKVDPTATSDWGNVILSRYKTAYLGDATMRRLVLAFRGYVRGSGTLGANLAFPDETTTTSLPTRTLASSPMQDLEWPAVRQVSERAALDFTTGSVAGDWFSLEKLAILYRPKAVTAQRGRHS